MLDELLFAVVLLLLDVEVLVVLVGLVLGAGSSPQPSSCAPKDLLVLPGVTGACGVPQDVVVNANQKAQVLNLIFGFCCIYGRSLGCRH